MQCGKCGREVPADARFCPGCGASLADLTCGACGATASSPDQYCRRCGHAFRDETLEREVAAAEADRRHVAVLFCDLVDSTELSTRLDPEDYRAVIRAYHSVAADVIARLDGHIAQYLGDGVLAYFGYPRSHEDNAARAVRAGLGIVEDVRALNAGSIDLHGARLSVRGAIHTGLVVVDEMGGAGRHERLAMGQTPNVAARLQGLARANEVVITAETQQRVDAFFITSDLGLHQLKGMAAPMRVFSVVGPSPARTRLDAVPAEHWTRLVGRAQETALLLHRWEQVIEGQGQAVLLVGEPGIGKSRLVEVFEERAQRARDGDLECRCSPYHTRTPLYPVTDLLSRRLQWGADAPPEVKRATLETAMNRAGGEYGLAVPFLASLLSLPGAAVDVMTASSRERQRRLALEALAALVLSFANEDATVLIVEDLHWADPTTLEFLTVLLDLVSASRLMILLTARPSFGAPWPARSHVTTLPLTRLTSRQTEAMVTSLTGGKALPATVLQQIVERTDGVPLFIEESTRTVLDSGMLTDEGDRYCLARPLESLAIPATLQDLLMAQLDRLSAVKELAQLAAALGREFTYDVLAELSPWDDVTLQGKLARLVTEALLVQRGHPPHARYTFRHALIQETAYQSMLKSRRQRYHAQIVRVLEGRGLDQEPELMAWHCTEAGLREQAITYRLQAGQRAVERGASVEAIGHFTHGLSLLASLPDTAERDQQELALHIAIGAPLVMIKGSSAPDVERTYARARELCDRIGDAPHLFPALLGLVRFHLTRADLATAADLAGHVQRLATAVDEPTHRLIAHAVVGATSFYRGELTGALDHLAQVTTLYDPVQHRFLSFVYGDDPRLLALGLTSWTLWRLGHPDQALACSRRARAAAEELDVPYGRTAAGIWTAALHHYRGEVEDAEQRAAEALALATRHGFEVNVAQATILHGWALVKQGERIVEGIADMRRGLAVYRTCRHELSQPVFLAMLADAYGRIGDADQGLGAIDDALDTISRTGERHYEAECWRLKGELCLKVAARQPGVDIEGEARASFHRAVDVARAQGARSWELRALTSLCRLERRCGGDEEPRRQLHDLCEAFTEGRNTRDWREANDVRREPLAAARAVGSASETAREARSDEC